jgi:hypothetical protein
MEELSSHNGMSLRRCIRFRDHVTDWPPSTGRGPWMSQDEAKPRPKSTDRLRALQIRRKCKIDLKYNAGAKGTLSLLRLRRLVPDVFFGDVEVAELLAVAHIQSVSLVNGLLWAHWSR